MRALRAPPRALALVLLRVALQRKSLTNRKPGSVCLRAFCGRGARFSFFALAILLSGCGYVGDPLPPALKRPVGVTDLAAVQRGSNIIVQFTIPKITTEGLQIRGDQDIELRAGPAPEPPFHIESWEKTAERIKSVPQEKPVARVSIPAADFYGKTVVIGVRVHGPKGRNVGWSNLVALPIVPALPTPAGLEAKNVPDAVELSWHAAASQFRVFRKAPGDPDWTQIGISDKPDYTDKTIEYGKTYQYFVQAIEKTGESVAESDLSETIDIKPEDKFAPAVPAGLTAVLGTRSVELVWERSAEHDFAQYRLYRNGQRIAEGIRAPAYSDKTIQSGAKYAYQVSAVDTTGNESARSSAVEIVTP